jgi:Sigma-70 region 2
MADTCERLFEIEWPVLARRIDFLLVQRGVSRADREDIVQETGLRLLRMWSRVDQTRSAHPLATTIALNIWRDAARRPRREVLGLVPDIKSHDDVESAGVARAELKEVVRYLDAIPTRYRDALLAEVGCEPEPAHKMVRMRARRALKKMAGGRELGLGLLTLRIRRAGDILEALLGLRGAVGAGATSLAIVGLLLPIGPIETPDGLFPTPKTRVPAITAVAPSEMLAEFLPPRTTAGAGAGGTRDAAATTDAGRKGRATDDDASDTSEDGSVLPPLPEEPTIPLRDGDESPGDLVPEPPIEVPDVPTLPGGENPPDILGDSLAL